MANGLALAFHNPEWAQLLNPDAVYAWGWNKSP